MLKLFKEKGWLVASTLKITPFCWNVGAPNIVPLPTKVEYLNGINIKMAALGSEHSVAISGMQKINNH